MNDMSRADLHVHSSASAISRLGVQRSLMIPECATDPLEVYELAKARGMDFVTITDHDTIDGALSLAHLPDTFISEELTAGFRGEPQAVHVLCYGITPAITNGSRPTATTSKRARRTSASTRSPPPSPTRSMPWPRR